MIIVISLRIFRNPTTAGNGRVARRITTDKSRVAWYRVIRVTVAVVKSSPRCLLYRPRSRLEPRRFPTLDSPQLRLVVKSTILPSIMTRNIESSLRKNDKST